MSSNDEPSASDDEYDEKRELRQRPRKRRKRNDGRVKKKVGIGKGISLVPLLELVETEGEGGAAFNEVIEQLLPEYLHTRATFQEKEIETDQLVRLCWGREVSSGSPYECREMSSDH